MKVILYVGLILQLQKDLRAVSDSIRARHSKGDIFLGLTVPQAWQLARKYQYLSLDQIKHLTLASLAQLCATPSSVSPNPYAANTYREGYNLMICKVLRSKIFSPV